MGVQEAEVWHGSSLKGLMRRGRVARGPLRGATALTKEKTGPAGPLAHLEQGRINEGGLKVDVAGFNLGGWRLPLCWVSAAAVRLALITY